MQNNFKLSNNQIIFLFKETLYAMEVKKVNFFKIRAYQNAIAVFDTLTTSVYDIWQNNNLDSIPGIGTNIQHHLNELFLTGTVKDWEDLKKGLPEGMFGLIGLRSVGAIKAFKLAQTFNLKNRDTALDELLFFAKNQKIREIEGFGEKSELQILEAIEQSKTHKSQKTRTLLLKAEEIMSDLQNYMYKLDCVKKVEACGSFRRRNPTVGDLDVPIATTDFKRTMEHFLKYTQIADIVTKGEKRSTVILKNEMQVDLYVVDTKSFGAMVQYFTGNKQHNILIRSLALDKGLSLSEYGIKNKYTNEITEFESEIDFYEFLGLQYIPPEIRHGTNEIDLASKKMLPKLVEIKDIKGDLHIHTTDSPDSDNDLDEVILKCISLGYQYIGISDHVASIQTQGYEKIQKIILEKRNKINIANQKYQKNGIKILLGYEVNILSNGELSWPDELLSLLDYAIAGVHSSLNQDKDTMTQRIISAIKNPYINFIAHPTNRLINERSAVNADWNLIFNTIKEYKKFLEINANPQRLDLTYDLVKEALDIGIKFLINTDSHSIGNFDLMKYGVDVARMGWCRSNDIINCLNYNEFGKMFLKVKN